MSDNKSVFYSKKLFIFNIALVSMIVGFALSLLMVYACSNEREARISNAYAQDYNEVEKGYEALENIQYSFRNVANVALPVVVEINVVEVVQRSAPGPNSPWDFFFTPPEGGGEAPEFRRPGLGSGVIVEHKDNMVYVMTNNHVVGNASEISVLLHDGRNYDAKIVAKDERTDLALISFETRDDIPVASLGDSDSVYVGDWAIAVGNPFGFESTLTVGVVSALGRSAVRGSSISSYNEYIQTDADINPGNSGGALLNIRGEVIGINTWIASETGVSSGIGFAIPINNVKKVMNDFISKGRVEYGWLGVGIDDPETQIFPGVARDLKIEGKDGALVVSVFKNSPADRHGILPGDYIIRVDGHDVKNANQLTRIVGGLPPNKSFEFVVIRYGQEKRIPVTLAVREAEDKVRSNTQVWPGFNVVGLTDDLRKRLEVPASVSGVLASGVTPGTPAETAGLKMGDIIMQVNNRRIGSVMDFYRNLNDKGKNEVIFRVWRDSKEIVLGIVR
ncbi:MAG TPA: Do family serine endopeptidase [Spirochaetia bacterium]|nr:Do family serine endopeptidase [Spirochaetia bacterium]